MVTLTSTIIDIKRGTELILHGTKRPEDKLRSTSAVAPSHRPSCQCCTATHTQCRLCQLLPCVVVQSTTFQLSEGCAPRFLVHLVSDNLPNLRHLSLTRQGQHSTKSTTVPASVDVTTSSLLPSTITDDADNTSDIVATSDLILQSCRAFARDALRHARSSSYHIATWSQLRAGVRVQQVHHRSRVHGVEARP
jgi:hypothetical protein